MPPAGALRNDVELGIIILKSPLVDHSLWPIKRSQDLSPVKEV
jgi:hypothetical protein